MTRRDELLALADRVEAATGADRELDADIAVAAAGFRRVSESMLCKDEWDYASNADGYFLAWPRYTASIDAALTLVPSGWTWSIVHEREWELSGKPAYFSDLRRGYRTSYDNATLSWSATPALALTAAALRALAQETPDD